MDICVILAGGKSSRMGRDKTLLPFGGFATLTHFQAHKFSQIFRRVFVSSKFDKFNPPLRLIKDVNLTDLPTFQTIAEAVNLPARQQLLDELLWEQTDTAVKFTQKNDIKFNSKITQQMTSETARDLMSAGRMMFFAADGSNLTKQANFSDKTAQASPPEKQPTPPNLAKQAAFDDKFMQKSQPAKRSNLPNLEPLFAQSSSQDKDQSNLKPEPTADKTQISAKSSHLGRSNLMKIADFDSKFIQKMPPNTTHTVSSATPNLSLTQRDEAQKKSLFKQSNLLNLRPLTSTTTPVNSHAPQAILQGQTAQPTASKEQFFSPMLALYSILSNFPQKSVFIVPADMPFVSVECVRELYQYADKFDMVIAADETHAHALCGFFNANLATLALELLAKNEHKIGVLRSLCKHKIVKFEDAEQFLNINYPSEYEEALAKGKI